jgi:hypothetical protein
MSQAGRGDGLGLGLWPAFFWRRKMFDVEFLLQVALLTLERESPAALEKALPILQDTYDTIATIPGIKTTPAPAVPPHQP